MKYGEFKILVAALGVASLTLQGCGKYEDGPAISLKTKNQRLTGEWKLVKALGMNLENETTITFEFQKDGDFKQRVSYNYGGSSTSYSYDGDWKWVDGKESLLINVDGDVLSLDVLKLTSKEMTLEYKDTGYSFEMEFEKQ